jgi:hypothetical protein
MLAVHGGKGRKNKRGGGLADSASPYSGVGDLASPRGGPNYAENPTIPPQNRMIGGSAYGYASGADAATYGGSYAPIKSICTNGNTDPNRGGNNFMSGGSRRKHAKRTNKRISYKKHKRSSGGTKHKRTKHKRSGKKGGKTYKQKGCSKLKGGLLLV